MAIWGWLPGQAVGIQGGTSNYCPVHQEHPPPVLTWPYQHLNAEEEVHEKTLFPWIRGTVILIFFWFFFLSAWCDLRGWLGVKLRISLSIFSFLHSWIVSWLSADVYLTKRIASDFQFTVMPPVSVNRPTVISKQQGTASEVDAAFLVTLLRFALLSGLYYWLTLLGHYFLHQAAEIYFSA